MFSTTIMIIHKQFHGLNISKNYFAIVRRTSVRGSTLARLATVLVLLFPWKESPALRVMATNGKLSTKFPLGELEGQEPLAIFLKTLKFHKKSVFSKTIGKHKVDRTLEFQIHFRTSGAFL